MQTTVHADAEVAGPLLSRMFLPIDVLVSLAGRTGGERANVAATEPPAVAGYETWRWATRFLREEETLRELGWELCEADQVYGIRHPKLGIKLVACTTDANTGTEKSPRNVTEKGPASRRLIARNSGQMSLFAEEEKQEDEPKDQLWYFCLHMSEKHIAIEVSRPDSEVDGMIVHFSDRIIVAPPGVVPGIRKTSVPEEFADLPKPQVTRK